MEPSLTTLIVATLAAGEILEIWNHSLLGFIATWRARTREWEGFLGELLSCMFCLAPWASLFTLLALGWVDWPGRPVTQLVMWALAAARLANLVNDLTRGSNRVPRA